VLLRLSYERSNDRQTLAEAVARGRAAVDEASPDDPAYPLALSGLGNTLQELFGCDQDPAHLAEAAKLYRRAIRAIPPAP
jgi:hypothetical protein